MQGHKKLNRMLVVVNSYMEWKITKSHKKIGSCQHFYVRILHHEHFENITSIFNKNTIKKKSNIIKLAPSIMIL
jgi:hypothetical protein